MRIALTNLTDTQKTSDRRSAKINKTLQVSIQRRHPTDESITVFNTALNHIIQPTLSIDAFFALAKAARCTAVEIRNDLDGTAILDGTDAQTIKRLSIKYDLDILSINALQKFNLWNEERSHQAHSLFDFAQACGATAVVLVPDNDGKVVSKATAAQALREALTALQPLLKARELIGLIEPLGFETASLRLKRDAIDAICDIDGSESFALVHDTFHHYLSEEKELFPDHTGLIHASGVTEQDHSTLLLRDEHRALIDDNDILGNTEQIGTLLKSKPDLVVSLEPFSPDTQKQPEPLVSILECFNYLSDSV